MTGTGATLQVDEVGQEPQQADHADAVPPGSALFRVTEPVRGRLLAALAEARARRAAGGRRGMGPRRRRRHRLGQDRRR
ncbi:hypothetical protein [Nocardia cyriacigeorgica]|uniref:hypothetical protein n=1 Tax=Nocardia cyriacigeorgica TaxID=135487 RepID=UPI0024576D33|nr:hypothetical protein [Nocardia cyriacigeorgica]